MTINIDPLAHKATFNSTCAQFVIQLACVELIDLLLQIFEMICYKANIISTDNLPYGVIITKLLLFHFTWHILQYVVRFFRAQLSKFS